MTEPQSHDDRELGEAAAAAPLAASRYYPYIGQIVEPPANITSEELANRYKTLAWLEIEKKIAVAKATPASALDAGEITRLATAINALLRIDDHEQAQTGTREPALDWSRLSPAELEEHRIARDALDKNPGDVRAAMTAAGLRAKAAASSTGAPSP